MTKCNKCGKLYDNKYNSCPYCNLGNKKLSQEDALQAGKGCLGCLGLIFLVLMLIIVFDKPIEKTVSGNYKEEAMITLGNIPYDESDLPYLEDYIKKYFTKVELQDYVFKFYIDPDVWKYNPVSGKEAIMERCAAYGLIKTNQIESNSNAALSRVHILNVYNGDEIGTYGITGYKFK